MLLFAFITLTLLLLTRIAVNKPEYYRLGTDKNVLILGHSASACAFNDSLIYCSRNLSDPTEGYFFTYIKTRKVIKSNPQIHTCFIEFTNNQIGEFANERIYGQYASHLLQKYLYHLNVREYIFLLAKNPLLPARLFLPVIKKNIEFLTLTNKSYIQYFQWGGFTPQRQRMTREVLDSLEKIHNPKGNALVKYNYGFSKENLWSLARTVKFLKAHNVKVIFVRSPLLNSNEQLSTEGAFQDIRRNEFRDIPFLDLNLLRLKASDFADLAHVNVEGASKCSSVLNTFLEQGLVESASLDSLFRQYLRTTTSQDIRHLEHEKSE